MKASKQYFPVVLFTKLYKVDLLTSESVDESCGFYHSNETYFAELLQSASYLLRTFFV